MGTYLLAWNPARWHRTEAEWQEDIAQLARLGPEDYSWSLGTNFRRIRRGDRLFLMKVGRKSPGIFASGRAVKDPYPASHWDGEEGHYSWYVDVHWDPFRNPYHAPSILSRDELFLISAKQRWSPLRSGEEIKGETAAKLEDRWKEFQSSEGHTQEA